MTAIPKLISELKGKGVLVRLGGQGRLEVGTSREGPKPSPEDLLRLKANRKRLEVYLKWRRLQDISERKFSWPGARLYPFFACPASSWWLSPRIRTPIGECHLVQVRLTEALVVKVSDLKRSQEQENHRYNGPSFLIPHQYITPPKRSPEEVCPWLS